MERATCTPSSSKLHESEVLSALSPWLDERDLRSLSMTNRDCREAVLNDPCVWTDLHRRRWPEASLFERSEDARKSFFRRMEGTRKWKYVDPDVCVGDGVHCARPSSPRGKGTDLMLCSISSLALACREVCVIMSNTKKGKLSVQDRMCHSDAISCVEAWEMSGSGYGAATGCRDGGVKVVMEGSRSKVLRGHAKRICSVKYVPRGRNCTLVTSSADSTIMLWNVPEGGDLTRMSRRSILRGHGEAVTHLAVSGTHLLSAGMDGKVKLWDLERSHCLQTAKFPGPIKFLKSVGEAGVVVATAKGFSILARGGLSEVHTYPGENFLCMDASCLRGRAAFAIGRDNGTVKLWDSRMMEPQTTSFSDGETPVSHLRMDTWKLVAGSSSCCTVKVWGLPSMDLVHRDLLACAAQKPEVSQDLCAELLGEVEGTQVQAMDMKVGSFAALLRRANGNMSVVVADFEQSVKEIGIGVPITQIQRKSKFWQYEELHREPCSS